MCRHCAPLFAAARSSSSSWRPGPCCSMSSQPSSEDSTHRKGEVITMAETNGGIPDFIRPVLDVRPMANDRQVAEHAVLALNESMMNLYDETLETFKRNMRGEVPIIVALCSGQGGQMILYPPGQPA